MRHFRLAVLLSTFILAVAGSAFADTVNMSFTGPGGNNSGGVYTYPYVFTVGTGPDAYSALLICDAFNNEVSAGETWTATVNTLTGGNGLFGSQAGSLNNYKAAGLIFQGIVNGQISANVGNWAIWGLFSPEAKNNAYYQSSGAGALALTYQILAAFVQDPNYFSNLVLYTPIDGTQMLGGKAVAGLPQEYIGIRVPEPAEIAMLALMLVGGVMGFAFRQRLGLKLAVSQA